MTRVDRVETIPVAVPAAAALANARTASADGTDERHDRLLVRVALDDGTVGWGEVAPHPTWPHGATTSVSRAVVDEDLAPLVVDESLADLPSLVGRLRGARPDAPFALAGVDVALHDALGRSRGVSVSELLGGARTRTLRIHHTVGIRSPDAVRAEATAAADRGVRAFKCKVGGDVDADVARVAAVREAVPDAEIRVDANGAWTPDEALRAVGRLDDAAGGLVLLEQPCPSPADLRRVRRRVDVPVMADESAGDADAVARLADADAVDAVNLKTATAGGLVGALDAAAVAREKDLDTFLGGMAELGVGAAASAQFGAIVDPDYPTGVFTRLGAERLLTDDSPVTPDGASLTVSQAPGLGVTVDPGSLERVRTDCGTAALAPDARGPSGLDPVCVSRRRTRHGRTQRRERTNRVARHHAPRF